MFGEIGVLSLWTVLEMTKRLFCAIIPGFIFVSLKKKITKGRKVSLKNLKQGAKV